MLNTILITQNETTTLLYEKVFFQEMNEDNLEIFTRFLAALKSFISEMVVDGSKELKSVSLGDYSVKTTHIPEINSDLVLVVDKEDQKLTNKLIPAITEIIKTHKELFLGTEKTSDQFKTFDQEINNLILSNKNLIDESLSKGKDDVFKSIWTQKGGIFTKLRDNLIKEKEKLQMLLQKENNYSNRSVLLEKLIKILENLNEEKELIKTKNELKTINDEINDRKIRLKFYLESTKEALKYKDYNKAYSCLYSFSSKLKNMARPQVQKKYHTLANILASRNELPKIEFSQAISEILISPDNIDEYLP